jgi:hypothetical protein
MWHTIIDELRSPTHFIIAAILAFLGAAIAVGAMYLPIDTFGIYLTVTVLILGVGIFLFYIRHALSMIH